MDQSAVVRVTAQNDQAVADMLAKLRANLTSPEQLHAFDLARAQLAVYANNLNVEGLSEEPLRILGLHKVCLQIGCCVLQEHVLRWYEEIGTKTPSRSE